MGFSADLDLGLCRRKVSGAGGGNLRVVGQSMKRHELGVSDDAPSRPLSRTSRAESMGSLADFSQHTSYQLPAELEHAHRHKQVSLLTPLQADASFKSCLQSSTNDLTNKSQHFNFGFAFAFKVLSHKIFFFSTMTTTEQDQSGSTWEAGACCHTVNHHYHPLLSCPQCLHQT